MLYDFIDRTQSGRMRKHPSPDPFDRLLGIQVLVPDNSVSADCNCFNRWPTCTIPSSAGISSSPSDVSSYSVDGGEVLRTWRRRIPRFSSSDSRVESTFAEIGGMSDRSSLNRRGPARNDHITFGAQAPAMIDMHSVSMQGSGGLGLRLCRILSAISSCQVTE